MRTGRSYVATAVALGIITLSGCAAETADQSSTPGSGLAKGEDWGDPSKYPELGGAFASLTAFGGTCTFVAGTMTVTATAAVDQTIIIGKRAVDSAILVNGALQSGCTTATSSTVKALKVVGTTGNQTVIVDFLGGVFAPGIATARGIAIDLGANTDEVRFRGTAAADSWIFGSDGLAVNTDAFRDVDFAGVENFSFSLAGGDDTLTGTIVPAGAGAGKGVTATATLAFTAFGGEGKDTITGGDKSDIIYGGPGADTLSGGGTGASSEKDWIAGQQGADVITQGAAMNGPDVISCGVEDLVDSDHPDLKDTVSYALRGSAAARDVTSAGTLLATDSERVKVILVSCTQTTPTDCDIDAKGFVTFAGNSGEVTEAFGSLGTLVQHENDAIDADCEIIVGGMDNDVLTGSDPDALIDAPLVINGAAPVVSGINQLSGGPGDDLIVGGLGADVLSGDDGADTIDESGGTASTDGDVINGGAGIDTVSYDTRAAAIIVTMDGVDADDGEAGEVDNIKADVENLVGTDNNDKITGNLLDNVLTGGLGVDDLTGGAGNDTFYEGTVTNGGDKFTGGDGVDTVDYSARSIGVFVTMAGEAADDGEAGTQQDYSGVIGTDLEIIALESATPTAAGVTAEADQVMLDVENCNGSLVDDVLIGNDSANSLDGGPGADFLFGGVGDDVLFGGSAGVGDETINTVDLNGDSDTVDTAAAVLDSNDYLYGGAGNDILDGSGPAATPANKLVCGAGEDIGYNQGTVTFVPSTGVGAYRDSSCES